MVVANLYQIRTKTQNAQWKNDFAEGSKILLNFATDLKSNFVGTLKIMSNATKNFDNLTISLNVLHNYFDNSTKLLFWSISS